MMGVFLLVMCHLSLVAATYAEVIESIAVIVDDDLILLSEFREAFQSVKASDSLVSRESVLKDMIDKLLLLNEAKKYRISASDKTRKTEMDNSIVVEEYIDRRITALIHVPYSRIEHYYQINRDLYGDKEIIDVRDAIEEQLVETEMKTKLLEHIEELRKKAYVRIQLKDDN
jgi:hypothetical protein